MGNTCARLHRSPLLLLLLCDSKVPVGLAVSSRLENHNEVALSNNIETCFPHPASSALNTTTLSKNNDFAFVFASPSGCYLRQGLASTVPNDWFYRFCFLWLPDRTACLVQLAVPSSSRWFSRAVAPSSILRRPSLQPSFDSALTSRTGVQIVSASPRLIHFVLQSPNTSTARTRKRTCPSLESTTPKIQNTKHDTQKGWDGGRRNTDGDRPDEKEEYLVGW
ncbi:uncharacterized protein IWZ02DRAFT_110610 [Phyllosticta citriasiana]|uniref:Secreted protein n=1 Tax=Phyllosticta citriasiana TaxID=595635 RepID=A0ABR1KGK5_9PEZI